MYIVYACESPRPGMFFYITKLGHELVNLVAKLLRLKYFAQEGDVFAGYVFLLYFALL